MKLNRKGITSFSNINTPNAKVEKLGLGRQDSSLYTLCDLHVYKVPPELWRDAFNNILNNAVTETVSVGIIRVPAEIRLVDVREEIVQQLDVHSEELLPRDYVFLRCVGRSLTTLRGKQEYALKAKHFIPPIAYAPELYILEATPELREALAGSDVSSQSPPLSRQTSPHGYPNIYRPGNFGSPETKRSNKSVQHPQSPSNKYKPLPHISRDPYRSRDPHKKSPNRDPSSSPDPQTNRHNSHNHPNNPNSVYNHSKNNSKHKPYKQDPGSEWDVQPETWQEAQDRSPSHKQSPVHSAGKGRGRKQDDDVGVSGLSPEDEQNKHNNEEYDNKLRRTRDMQKRLESDKFMFDAETEEERRRQLEDLEDRNMLDRERWDADQEERRRRAMKDRKQEDDRKKKEEKDKRKMEEEERKKKEEEERRKKEEEERKREEEDIKREEKRKEEEKRKTEEQKKEREAEEKQKLEENKKRQEEEEKKKKEDEKRKRELEKREQEELDQKRKEEENKLKKEMEEKRKKEEEKQQKEQLEKRKEDEKQRKPREEKSEFPSPPLQHMPPPEHGSRDTESAKQRRRNEKNQLLKDVEDARQARQEQEKIREELVRKAKQMQHKTSNRRNEARDMWKKKYFEEKKKTAPLEESSNRLQNELETLHKRLMNTLEGPKEKHLKLTDARPSEKNNYIIQSTKLQHEIEDLQLRVENARMKLTAEMKLRNQAQGELRALRAELTQRKQSIEQTRQHQLAALSTHLKNGSEDRS